MITPDLSLCHHYKHPHSEDTRKWLVWIDNKEEILKTNMTLLFANWGITPPPHPTASLHLNPFLLPWVYLHQGVLVIVGSLVWISTCSPTNLLDSHWDGSKDHLSGGCGQKPAWANSTPMNLLDPHWDWSKVSLAEGVGRSRFVPFLVPYLHCFRASPTFTKGTPMQKWGSYYTIINKRWCKLILVSSDDNYPFLRGLTYDINIKILICTNNWYTKACILVACRWKGVGVLVSGGTKSVTTG